MRSRSDPKSIKNVCRISWGGKTYFCKNKRKIKNKRKKKKRTFYKNAREKYSALFLQIGEAKYLYNKKSRELSEAILSWYLNSYKSSYFSCKMLAAVSSFIFQIRRVRRITEEGRFNHISNILDRQENPVPLWIPSRYHQKW